MIDDSMLGADRQDKNRKRQTTPIEIEQAIVVQPHHAAGLIHPPIMTRDSWMWRRMWSA